MGVKFIYWVLKMDKAKLITLFTESVSIISPSGSEGKTAVWIKNKLEPAGWEVWVDKTGQKNESDTGNVYAYLEADPKFETLVFCAHMDTVAKPADEIKVVFDGEVFRSDGNTILGADNRGGIVPLIFLGLNIRKEKLKDNLLLFFPTREEGGKMGSSFFEFDRSKVKYVFNMDGGDSPGTFVYKSLGFLNFVIKVKGVAAHAAAAYEKGKNAILVASEIVKSLPLGKDEKEGTTLNIGYIQGGGATNIVPDFVEIKGELRAFEELKMKKLFEKVSEICSKVAKTYGVDVTVEKDADQSYATPFKGVADSEICRVCQEAAEKVGLKPILQSAYYTSDANNFSGKGFQTIVVSRGGKNAHSKEEEIALEDIVKTCELVQELARVS